MKSIQMTGLTAPRFAVSASVVPAPGLAAAQCGIATTIGHAEGISGSIGTLAERIPSGGTGVSVTADASAYARPRTSVNQRSDL